MLIGNLGADPEIKYAQSGTPIANFNIATSENRKNSDGEWEDITEWHKVVMFGRQAEVCKDYLHKGSKIFIEGRLQTRSWDDKDGKKHYMTEVVGFNMVMLDPKGMDTSTNAPEPSESPVPDMDTTPEPSEDIPKEEDDLPF